MRSKRMAVGTNYYNASAYPWDTGGGCTGNEICNADLAVQGNVGIGTTAPDYKLSFGPDQGGASNILAFVDEASPNNAMRGIGGYNSGGIYGLAFWASLGDAATVSNTRMIIRADNGNVGIGTANPQDMLDVYGGGDNIVSVVDSASKLGVWIGHNGTRGIIRTTYWGGLGGSDIFTPLTFQTNNVDRLYIATNGNVGIGTTGPNAKLEIMGGKLGISDIYVGGGKPLAQIQGYPDPESGNNGGTFIFYTRDGSGAGPEEVERLRIKYNGYIGVGVNPGYRLDLPNDGTPTGQGRANAWVTYSSGRWKENITPISNGIGLISQLNPVYFNWKKEYGGSRSLGFIAEEVGKIMPELVDYEEDGVYAKSLDYAKLSAVCVQGIKELDQRTKQQQKEIEHLRAKLMALEEKMGKEE